MAEDNTQSPSPHTELQRLDAFAGTWKTEGQVTMPDGSVVEMNGTDSYEWLPGKFF